MAIVFRKAGKYLPEAIFTNEDAAKMLATNNTRSDSGNIITAEDIGSRTGIFERRRAREDQNTSDLAYLAALDAITGSGLDWSDLKGFVVGTSSPERIYPSTAALTLNHLPNPPKIEAWDLSAACSSSLFGIAQMQARMIVEPGYDHTMVCGAEVLASRMSDWRKLNATVFGDGAGAVILSKIPDQPNGPGIICSNLICDSSLSKLTDSVGMGTRVGDRQLMPDNYYDGKAIQKFVLTIMPPLVHKTIEKANQISSCLVECPITLDDIDLFITHQVNGYLFTSKSSVAMPKRLGVSPEKFFHNVERYGNTSSASILICLAEAWEQGLIKPGKIVMFLAFGGGITYGSMLIRI